LTDHPPNRREEDDETVAKKGPKRSATKKAAGKSPKTAARRPAGKAAGKATTPLKRAPVTVRPAPPPAGPTLEEHAERLRDEILRSKLTHPDPWRYAPKAREWGERGQALVERIAAEGDTPATRRSLETLDAELRGDRDFQEARRLF
jgi:hypothetical protein